MPELNCYDDLNGLTISCEDLIVAGVKRAWASIYSATTVWSGNSNHQIASATTHNPIWVEYQVDEQTSQLREEIAPGPHPRVKAYRQNLEIAFLGQSQTVRNAANELSRARLRWIVELESGEYVLVGETKALIAGSGASTSGMKEGDEPAIRLTFTGLVNAFAPTVTDYYVLHNLS